MLPNLRQTDAVAALDHRSPPADAVPVAGTERGSRFVVLKPRPPAAALVARSPEVAPPDEKKGTAARNVTLLATPTVRDSHATAFSLIDDVRTFIPKLIQANADLRDDLTRLTAEAQAELAAAEERYQALAQVYEQMKARSGDLEKLVLDLKIQVQRTEATAAVERELASAAGQEAAEAECLSKLFEDKVISAFGIGSMFQEALARMADQR